MEHVHNKNKSSKNCQAQARLHLLLKMKAEVVFKMSFNNNLTKCRLSSEFLKPMTLIGRDRSKAIV